jgi:hypothetical protein
MDITVKMYGEKIDGIRIYFLTLATVDDKEELFNDYQIYTFLGLEKEVYYKYMIDLGAKNLTGAITFYSKKSALEAKEWLEEHLEGFLIAKELTKQRGKIQ